MMDMGILPWVGFNVFVLAMLALDLGVINRKAHVIGLREAIGWSIFWISLALIFCVGIGFFWPDKLGGYTPHNASLAFLTGYLIEKSLSVDNLFVFLMLFKYFGVPSMYQHKVLFWGILGALVMRAIFIFSGVALIERFSWTIYILGALLIITGVKLAFAGEHEVHPEKNPVFRLMRKYVPMTDRYVGARFTTRVNGRLIATPLLLVLAIVETTDVVFAVDSIPAILGITTNAFIVYTSNVFAILGLRALYFALSGFMNLFCYLNYGLSAVLVFVGCKMLVHPLFGYKMPVAASLGVVGGILAIAVIASVWRGRKDARVAQTDVSANAS